LEIGPPRRGEFAGSGHADGGIGIRAQAAEDALTEIETGCTSLIFIVI
jgi:hypothetical protein